MRVAALHGDADRARGTLRSTAFFYTPDGTATARQPNFAHLFFPCNDHPRDKATFTFRLDVPAGEVAVANGVPSPHDARGRTVWTYELAPADGHRAAPDRGRQLRPDRPAAATAACPCATCRAEPDRAGRPGAALEPGQLDYMIDRVGRYPFDIFGSLIVDADLGSRSRRRRSRCSTASGSPTSRRTCGTRRCSTSSRTCGSATASAVLVERPVAERGPRDWYEFLYAEGRGQLAGDTEGYPDDTATPRWTS